MEGFTKRMIRIAAVMAAVFGAIAWSYGAHAADKVRVGKAVPFAFTFIPMEVGLEAGIWAKYGIEPDIAGFAGDAKMQQGLASNSLEFGLGSGPGMGFMAKGVPAKGVAAFAAEPRSIVLMVSDSSPSKGAADFKGKKIGVTTVGSLTDWLAKRMAMAEGWGPQGVTTVTVGGLESMLASLKTGQVDGVMIATEVAYMLEGKKEGKSLVNMSTYAKDFHTHIIFARQELIDKSPDLVQRFVNGWFATIRYMKQNKEKTVDVAARVLKMDKDVLGRTFDEEMPMMSDDGKFDPKAVAVLKDSFVEMEILDKKPEDTVLFTTKFVPAKP